MRRRLLQDRRLKSWIAVGTLRCPRHSRAGPDVEASSPTGRLPNRQWITLQKDAKVCPAVTRNWLTVSPPRYSGAFPPRL